MRTGLLLCTGLLGLTLTGFQRQNRPPDSLNIGDAAPKLSLGSLDEKTKLEISGKREKPLVLIFGSCT
ncbi:MAG: hypothetical protein KF784_13190 [Fimbriimonadaceae bacterium]|nr:hypothetical protein [Fimbriimonadaceae bacterium]